MTLFTKIVCWVVLLVVLSGCAAQGQGLTPTLAATVMVPQTAPTPVQAENTPTTQAMETATTVPTAATETNAPVTETAAGPQCSAPAELTPAMTEGPYFTAGSPEQTNLYQAGMLGQRLVLTGYVLNTDCQPVAGAKVDFWQADGQGVYDNNGYTLRGHQITGHDGAYRLETVVPGEYPGRTPHIHVKVQAPNGPELTSQVYFPGMAGNESDRIFDSRLVVETLESTDPDVMQAAFNFIITE